jgi:hypothetical protein
MTYKEFWALAQPQEDGCWIWQGSLNGRGYGRAYVGSGQDNAHRIAYRAVHGEIPDGMHVLHTCDVKRCVNPYHLHLGTNKQNMREYVERIGAYQAKLDTGSVMAIREAKASGATYAALASRYGVNPSTIKRACKGRTWCHLAKGRGAVESLGASAA